MADANLTCLDFRHYEDLLPSWMHDCFRFHDPDDTGDDECYCAEPIPDHQGWDVEARMEANKVCKDRLTVERMGLTGGTLRIELCCRCADESGVLDDEEQLVAIAERIVAEKAALAKAEAKLAAELEAEEDRRREGALRASIALAEGGYPGDAIARAGRALRGEANP